MASQSWVAVRRRPGQSGAVSAAENRTDSMVYVLAAVSGLVTLLAGAIAVGLATSETRDDRTWRLPWWLPPAALIGLPLLAVLGTATLSRPRLSLVRRLT